METQLPAQWKREYESWKLKMKEAQNQRSSSRTSSGRLAAEQMYRKAKSKISIAEEKMRLIKKWNIRLANELPEFQTSLLKLKVFLVNDFEKASHLIKEHAETLHDYTNSSRSKK